MKMLFFLGIVIRATANSGSPIVSVERRIPLDRMDQTADRQGHPLHHMEVSNRLETDDHVITRHPARVSSVPAPCGLTVGSDTPLTQ